MANEELITELLREIREDVQGARQEIQEVRQELRDHVADEMAPHHQASHAYVDSLIAREEKKSRLYDAIIEKSLAALVYGAIVAFGTAVYTYVSSHWMP